MNLFNKYEMLSNYICIFSITITVFVIAYFTNHIANGQNSNDINTYFNKTLGIKINYPSNWTITHLNDGVRFISPLKGSFGESLSYTIHNRNLSKWEKIPIIGPIAIKNNISKTADCAGNNIQFSKTFLDGVPASKLHYTCSIGEIFAVPFETTTTIYTTKNNKLYEISFVGIEYTKEFVNGTMKRIDSPEFLHDNTIAENMTKTFKIL